MFASILRIFKADWQSLKRPAFDSCSETVSDSSFLETVNRLVLLFVIYLAVEILKVQIAQEELGPDKVVDEYSE
jgi:hypothetical protein